MGQRFSSKIKYKQNDRLFDQYQKIMQHFKTTQEANEVIERYRIKYPYYTLGWIYEKLLFDLRYDV